MAVAGWRSTLRVIPEAAWATGLSCLHTIPLLNSVSLGPISPTAISGGHVRDGKSEIQSAYVGAGRKAPGFSGAQTPLTPLISRWLFANFLQDTTECAATTDLEQDLDYTTSHVMGHADTPEGRAFTFEKAIGDDHTKSIRMAGGLITKIGIDCPQLGSGVLSFDAIGSATTSPGDLEATPTLLTDTVLCTKDCVVKWATTTVTPISFNIELNNNGFPCWKKLAAPFALKRGPLVITGSMTFDWDGSTDAMIADMRDGSVNQLEFDWGGTGVDGFWNMGFDVRILPTPSQTEADNAERITVNFEACHLASGSDETWSLTTCTTEALDLKPA